jgi:hypothetical protein
VKLEEIRRAREAQIEALRVKVEAKHNADRKKLLNKANQLTAEKQRLKAEDDARRMRVERANLEEEMRASSLLKQIEERDAVLKAAAEKEAKARKAQIEAADAAKRAAIKSAQEKSRQLDEEKAARVEAKHEADRQKLVNKAQHLAAEKQRLLQQDSDRAKRTLQVRFEGGLRGGGEGWGRHADEGSDENRAPACVIVMPQDALTVRRRLVGRADDGGWVRGGHRR